MEFILSTFDRTVLEKFKDMPESKTKIKGKCKCYNNVDDVWTFTIEHADIKDDSASKQFQEKSQLMKIVTNSCSQNPVEPKQADSLQRRPRGGK